MSGMGRREFITLLGGAAAGWPLIRRERHQLARVPANFAGIPFGPSSIDPHVLSVDPT